MQGTKDRAPKEQLRVAVSQRNYCLFKVPVIQRKLLMAPRFVWNHDEVYNIGILF